MTNAKTFQNIPLSVLDLVPIKEGHDAGTAMKNMKDLAQHVDKWGFNRYWMAEHHNMPGIGSSATSVLIGHVAGATNRIRVGSGGVMLPNHATLVIAEQFGTLESLYPDRIDLGLGRAPGTDQETAFALRRTLNMGPEDFPLQVDELQGYFAGTERVHSVPGEGLNIPIWLLGSSDFSARLSAEKGLPFSFASHFAPKFTKPAVQLYRENFTPSETLARPHAMLGVNVIAADTDEEARYLATTLQQQQISMQRGMPAKLQPPIENTKEAWSETEQIVARQALDSPATFVGGPETVKRGLENYLEDTQADELIINAQIYDHQARLRSYEIVAELMDS